MFWELAVANSFKSHGSDVEFIPLSERKSVNTPDLLVKSKEGDLFVECKCVSLSSRSPISYSIIRLAISIIDDFCKNNALPEEFIISAVFKGGRADEADGIIKDLRSSIGKLNIDNLLIKGGCWDLEVNCDYPELTSSAWATLKIPLLDRPPILRGIAIAPISERRLVVFSSEQTSGLDRTIGDRIGKALGQLPERGLRAICIQISGYCPSSTDEFGYFCNWVLSDKRVGSLIKKHSAMKNGFVGAFIATDFFIENRDGWSFINYFQSGAGTIEVGDARKYFVGTQGFTEEGFSRYYG